MQQTSEKSKTMEISIENTFWDYLQFNWYYWLRSKFALVLLAILLFPVGWIMLDVAREWDFSSFLGVIVFSIMVVIVSGIVVLFMALIILLSTFVAYKGRNPKLAESKLRVAESGLVAEASVGRSELQWSAVRAIEQNKHCIFIFFNAYAACVVPKRAFANKAEADKFFNYTSELWGKSREVSEQPSAGQKPRASAARRNPIPDRPPDHHPQSKGGRQNGGKNGNGRSLKKKAADHDRQRRSEKPR